MKVLGIETTCDETGIAIVEDGEKIIINDIFSQIDLHQEYGGVFPEIASRSHLDHLIPMIAKVTKNQKIDLIAVANKPGLMGCILMGLSTAKALSYALDIPYVGVNHVEAHLYAAMMNQPKIFPSLGIVLSGGHTFLAIMDSINSYQIIGTTVDDAIGEAFDKVASLLDLPYPGGPHIEKLAKFGDKEAFPFKPGRVKGKPLNFSFSGLKTNILYTLKGPMSKKNSKTLLDETGKANVAASFQHTAFTDIKNKVKIAIEKYSPKAIYIGGGVTCNQALKEYFTDFSIPLYAPEKSLCLDNGAMIAGLGYHIFSEKGGAPLSLEAIPRILPCSL